MKERFEPRCIRRGIERLGGQGDISKTVSEIGHLVKGQSIAHRSILGERLILFDESSLFRNAESKLDAASCKVPGNILAAGEEVIVMMIDPVRFEISMGRL